MNQQVNCSENQSNSIEASGITIHIPGRTRNICVSTDEIICFEGEGNYTYIHTSAGKRYIVSRTIKNLMRSVGENFVRIHKSYMINTGYILEKFETERVIRMKGGKEVMISRRRLKEISTLLNAYPGNVLA